MRIAPALLALFAATTLPSCEILTDPAFVAGLQQGLQQMPNAGIAAAPSYPSFPSSTPSVRTTPTPTPRPTPRVASAPRSVPRTTASTPQRTPSEAPVRPTALTAVWEFVNKKSGDRWGFTGPCQRGATFWETREKALDLADASSKSRPTLIHQFDHHFTPKNGGGPRHYHVYIYDLQRPLESYETDIRDQLSERFGYRPSR